MKVNTIIAILLLTVFAVGTTCFVDTVEAAKWKKFDSGSFTDDNPDPGYTKKVTFVSYIKGSNDIKMVLYDYKSKNNKKIYSGYAYFNKAGKKFKSYIVDKKGKKTKLTNFNLEKDNLEIKIYYGACLDTMGLKNLKSPYLKSLKSTNTPTSGSTGSGSNGYRYVPDEYGYSYKYQYNSITGNYDYVYTYGIVKQGYWTWK